MAIIDGFEITVTSNGNVVDEYPVPSRDETLTSEHTAVLPSKHVVKYIEAIPGAKFELNYSVKRGQNFGEADYFSFQTQVDGHDILVPVAWKWKYNLWKTFFTTSDGARTRQGGRWENRPFVWTQGKTGELRP